MTDTTDRRGFLKACTKAAMAAAATKAAMNPSAALAHLLEEPPRARLVNKDGAPILASSLERHDTLIFNYPYKATPAMLVRLDLEPMINQMTTDNDGDEYIWPGGVGPDRSLVCYAAICAHALSYVRHETAFLHYSKEKTDFSEQDRVIICCAHGSVYDPAAAARVVDGPAEYPLAAINLEVDENDHIFATGAIGSEIFKEFYKAYRKELREEYGRKEYKKEAVGDVVALPPEEYSEDVLGC